MEFGNNLKILRKENKLSQEVLAEKIGVSRQAVSRWEVGSAYPEMSNIIALCQIFHCNINDLINENITDIEAFDEETKENIVKFKKNQQKNMKMISKAIYVVSNIVKIILSIAILISVVMLIVLLCSLKNVKVSDDNIEFLNQKIEYKICEDILTIENNEYYIRDNIDNKENFIINVLIYNYVCTIICVIPMIMFLHYLSQLYKNINKEETPFTINNEKIMNKTILFFIIQEFILNLKNIIYSILFKTKLEFDFNLKDIITLLVVISIIYIFKYGRLIQADSKAKIYDSK